MYSIYKIVRATTIIHSTTQYPDGPPSHAIRAGITIWTCPIYLWHVAFETPFQYHQLAHLCWVVLHISLGDVLIQYKYFQLESNPRQQYKIQYYSLENDLENDLQYLK